MTKIAIYARVSTDKQADSGVSLDAQIAKCRAYADLYGLEVVTVIQDTASGKTLERDGLNQVLTMLKSGECAGVLVAKLDRLTRSVRDLGLLIEGAFATSALMSVAEQIDTRSAAGRLVLNILSSVSQWEREVIAERTSTAMQHMKKQGQYTGGHVPYGSIRNETGALIPDDFEQTVIAQARELREAGLSLRKVALELDRRGLKTRKGKMFAPQQIKNMVA